MRVSASGVPRQRPNATVVPTSGPTAPITGGKGVWRTAASQRMPATTGTAWRAPRPRRSPGRVASPNR